MRDKRLLTIKSDRDVTRVLFISYNPELLNPTRQSLDGYVELSELFDEVHILILRTGIPPRYPVLRVAPNVYLYTAAARHWWLTPSAGMEMLENQLEFAAGFRPDLIVARDPFESAALAIWAGRKYDRPTQLHVIEDYSTSDFVRSSRQNFWRLFLPTFTVPRFSSVRTLTGAQQARLQKQFVVPDIATLPRFQNYETIINQKTDLVLKEKYKPVIFFLLFVGRLHHESTLYRALDAARFVLRNRRVGMVVLGEGKARGEFEKRAKLLGIEPQVIFESKVSNIIPYLKSANLLLVTDTDAESEEIVLQGAAAGVPIVMSRTEKREDAFTHGEDAFLCEANDVQAFTDCINELLNNIGLRNQFIHNGQDIIRNRFHADPQEYKEAYRTSIEQAFFVESDAEKQQTKE